MAVGFVCPPAAPQTTKMKTETTQPHRHAPLGLVIAAFAAVRDLGLDVSGHPLRRGIHPPFLMAGSRHLGRRVVALCLGAGARMKAPTLVEWRDAAIAGTLMLVVGNGGVTWAEQMIPLGHRGVARGADAGVDGADRLGTTGGIRLRALVGPGSSWAWWRGRAGAQTDERHKLRGRLGRGGDAAASTCWALGWCSIALRANQSRRSSAWRCK